MKTYTTSGILEQCDDWHNFLRTNHWLSGWLYRKSFTISRFGGAVSDYQFPLKVYYGSGTDGTESLGNVTAGKLYCNSLCQADFDDVRVTNSDGQTLMACWDEIVVASNYKILWIKFDSIGTSATTFYVYYGNAAAPSVSSGASTFIFFDGFDSINAVIWDTWGTVSASGSIVTIAANSGIWKGDDVLYGINTRWRARVRTSQISFNALFVLYGDNNNKVENLAATAEANYWYWDTIGGSGVYGDTGIAKDTANYHIHEVKRNASTSIIHAIDNVDKSTNTTKVMTLDALIYCSTEANSTLLVDWVLVSQWLVTEPAWGSWGGEESIGSIKNNLIMIGGRH